MEGKIRIAGTVGESIVDGPGPFSSFGKEESP